MRLGLGWNLNFGIEIETQIHFLKPGVENDRLLPYLRFSYKSSTLIACWSVSSSDQAPKLSRPSCAPWKIVMSLKIPSNQSYSASPSSKMKKWVITFESSVNIATLESLTEVPCWAAFKFIVLIPKERHKTFFTNHIFKSVNKIKTKNLITKIKRKSRRIFERKWVSTSNGLRSI